MCPAGARAAAEGKGVSCEPAPRGVPGTRSERREAASCQSEGRRGGSGENSEETGANFPEKQPAVPPTDASLGFQAPRREDPSRNARERAAGPRTAAGDRSGLERSESEEGMTRASGGDSRGRGPSAANARIQASSNA